MKGVVPIDAVTNAYRQGLAWQYSRLEALVDRVEQEKDALRAERLALAREREAFAEVSAAIASVDSRRAMESYINGIIEEIERKDKRRKRFPHPGGFDPRKHFK